MTDLGLTVGQVHKSNKKRPDNHVRTPYYADSNFLLAVNLPFFCNFLLEVIEYSKLQISTIQVQAEVRTCLCTISIELAALVS